MSEWHVTPDYIVSHWTEELLVLMVDKLNERKEAEMEVAKNPRSQDAGRVSDDELFSRMGVKVKHGD